MPRLVALAALAAVTVLAPAATAAPKACRLVTDPAGDSRNTGHTSTPYTDDVYDSTDLDILSADVATNGKSITAVIRTKTLRETDPGSPTGRMYELGFVVGEEQFVMSTTNAPGDTRGIVYHLLADFEEGGNGATMGEGIGRAYPTWDFKRGEVRVTAPLSLFAPYAEIVKGKPIGSLMAVSYHFYGVGGGRHDLPNGSVADYGSGGTGHGVDVARSEKSYVAGSPSCVAVGR